MTEIIRMTGTREQKIAAASKIKDAFETAFPEMANLRKQLIALGMAQDNLSSVARVVTEDIDYCVWRDDPTRYARLHAKPPIMTQEISDARQALASNPPIPANTVFDSRGSRRRR
jgi:hypothetical protein